MRLLHTSDWHLGRMLHGVDLLDEQRATLGQLCALVAGPPDGIAIDAVLVAGDIYDRAVPPVEAVSVLADVLAELTRHTTVILTSGNHDSAIRLGFGSRLFTERLHVRTELSRLAEPVLLTDADGQLAAVYPLPYLDPDAARTVLADGDEPLPRSHQAVLAAALERVRADLGERPATHSVVMAHAFVVGGMPTDSERSIAVGGVDSVAAGTFDGIDYVALGHLHGAQQPRGRSDTVLNYSGSLLRYSFSERTQSKSVALVDLVAGRPPTVRAIALRQPREMAELTGTLAELLAVEEHRDDWVRLTVTDRARPEQLFDRVKAHFRHVLQVVHQPVEAMPIGVPATAATGQQQPRELGDDFIAHVTGTAADPAELDLFDQAYQAALAATGGGR